MSHNPLSSEVGRVIADALAVSTKIGQQGNEAVALAILKVAELRLIRKALHGETSAPTIARAATGRAWKVQPDMQIFPDSVDKRLQK